MANHPERRRRPALLKNMSLGPKLIGFGVVLFVLTRVIVWLPLGFIGTWINGLLWPVLILSILAGAGMVFVKSRRTPRTA